MAAACQTIHTSEKDISGREKEMAHPFGARRSASRLLEVTRCRLLRSGERGGRVGRAYEEEVDLLPVCARARGLAALVHERRAEGALEGGEAVDLVRGMGYGVWARGMG